MVKLINARRQKNYFFRNLIVILKLILFCFYAFVQLKKFVQYLSADYLICKLNILCSVKNCQILIQTNVEFSVLGIFRKDFSFKIIN